VRRRYLDWLRGVAVLIMIEAHTVDAWTRASDRRGPLFDWALILGGLGAPIFLFLAGIALALGAGSRLRRGLSDSEVAARARRRAWQIFGLAFLFRLQSIVISGGSFPSGLLKVDILNVMGLSMLAAALLWQWGRQPRGRALLFVGAAVAAAMSTPIARESSLLAALPDPIEWYLRPAGNRTTFTLLPWGGFLLAGAAAGLWLDAARTDLRERQVNLALLAIGIATAAAGYASSYLPPIYPVTSFWTSSPTFFFIRLGIIIASVPVAFAWMRLWRGWSPIEQFGIASLFVYWIHVEMVYGVVSLPVHRALSLPQVLVALAGFSLFLFALVQLKGRLLPSARGRGEKNTGPMSNSAHGAAETG
jgi:uncharacterized membrane protein